MIKYNIKYSYKNGKLVKTLVMSQMFNFKKKQNEKIDIEANQEFQTALCAICTDLLNNLVSNHHQKNIDAHKQQMQYRKDRANGKVEVDYKFDYRPAREILNNFKKKVKECIKSYFPNIAIPSGKLDEACNVFYARIGSAIAKTILSKTTSQKSIDEIHSILQMTANGMETTICNLFINTLIKLFMPGNNKEN